MQNLDLIATSFEDLENMNQRSMHNLVLMLAEACQNLENINQTFMQNRMENANTFNDIKKIPFQLSHAHDILERILLDEESKQMFSMNQVRINVFNIFFNKLF
jgi:hypothetical protein